MQKKQRLKTSLTDFHTFAAGSTGAPPHGAGARLETMAEGDAKDGLGELGFESNAFETLEHDFQEVLTELVGDKSLERFRQEYEKLHRALKKSHDSEKRLIKKCRELNSEIVSNAAKVQTALKLSQEDQNTIASLKREIEKAWKMVDASHEKEARAKETISQLKSEISNLSRLVEQGAGLSMGQESQVNERAPHCTPHCAPHCAPTPPLSPRLYLRSLYPPRLYLRPGERAAERQGRAERRARRPGGDDP